MHCILIGICPAEIDTFAIVSKQVTNVNGIPVSWIGNSLAHDEGKPTTLLSATSEAPVDDVVAAVSESLDDGTNFSCELWASAPAIIPLKPPTGYDKLVINKNIDRSGWEEWATQTMREWGMFLQKTVIDAKEVEELRQYVYDEIEATEKALQTHRPGIEIGKDTFRFREIASRGNQRFDLLLQSSSAKDFVENIIIARIRSFLETILGSSNEVDFDISVVYSRPGAPNQGWHADGDHQKGAKDAGWDMNGWKTQLADPYGLCLFIPLIDLDDVTGYTQFWPASHRNRDLMGFGPVAEITEATWDGKCRAGDAVWYDYRLFHRGMPNTSQAILRPVVQIFFKKQWYIEKANYGHEGIADTSS